jgi:glycosyltransferase involved in cell wall biosynthesis
MSFGVAMISSILYPSLGGTETLVLRLSQQLQERGIAVFVVTRHHAGLARREAIGGIPVYRVGWGDAHPIIAALSYICGALRVLYQQRRRFQVMHCHLMFSPMTIGLLAQVLFGKPLVINPHRSGAIGDVGMLRLARPLTGGLRLLAARRWGRAFVCISPAIKEEMAGIGVDAARCWLIPNGVDTGHFHPADAALRDQARQRLGLPDLPLVVFVGGLVPEKGLDTLLDAWPQVLRELAQARLVLVGRGELHASLLDQAQRLGIAEQVIFAGSSDDVVSYLHAAAAFVLPSYAEGLPIALLEAMACGLPCVATAIDGSADLIRDGVNGRLVPPRDAGALAGALIEALTGPDAQQWASQARQEILARYTLAAITERYITLYRSLIQPQPEAS